MQGWTGARRLLRALLPCGVVLGLLLQPLSGAPAEKFQADDWRAECTSGPPAGECTIIVTFRPNKGDGSFALALEMETSIMAIVGRPPPQSASLQVDKNPAIRCSGPRYCLFSFDDSIRAAGQLMTGRMALLDVVTRRGAFHASISTIGYRAALAKIRAWRYPSIRRSGLPVPMERQPGK